MGAREESVLPAANVEEFLRAPVGRYIAGPSCIFWVGSPTLAGSVYFGRPDDADFRLAVALFELPGHPALAPPFDAVIDCGDLEAIGASGFELIVGHLRDVPRWKSRLRRASIVRPPGMAGAITTGLFYEMVDPLFDAALFTDRAQAFAWLGREDSAAVADRLDATLSSVHATPPLLRKLRELLAKQLGAPSVDGIAGALGLSARSLQRRLSELDTAFRDEVNRARVRAAEVLLVDTDRKLDAISREVGCASASHFGALFRQLTGETPSEFRARRRG